MYNDHRKISTDMKGEKQTNFFNLLATSPGPLSTGPSEVEAREREREDLDIKVKRRQPLIVVKQALNM